MSYAWAPWKPTKAAPRDHESLPAPAPIAIDIDRHADNTVIDSVPAESKPPSVLPADGENAAEQPAVDVADAQTAKSDSAPAEWPRIPCGPIWNRR